MDYPLTDESFAAALKALRPGRRLALAVSGGPDSLALLLLAKRYASLEGCQLQVLTVDHGLRPEAAQEAEDVAALCARLEVAHETLVWSGEKPEGNLQAEARRARYGLMGSWCLAHGFSDLLVAHHFDDQVETFLLRLARGSGVDGLSAMAAERGMPEAPGVRVLRPLLGFAKEELRRIVAAAGLQAVEDPSNENPMFDRVKVRQLRSDLEALGLGGARLVKTAAQMAEARAALEAMTETALARHVTFGALGVARLDCRALPEWPQEIGRRLLSHVLQRVSGRSYRPRLEKTERLLADLQGALDGDWTLHHCEVHVVGGEALIWREMRPLPPVLDLSRPGCHRGVWDGRLSYEVEGRAGLSLQALGADGLALMKAEAQEALVHGYPQRALMSAPAFWLDGRLLAVPGGFYGEVPGEVDFIGK